MAFVTVDAERCVRDGACVRDCPAGLIEIGPEGLPKAIPGAAMLCIHCGHCVAVCPTAALALGKVTPDMLEPVEAGRGVSAEAVVQFLRTCRSIRQYQNRPVPREELLSVLEATRWAASATNRQPVSWTVVESRERLNHLTTLLVDGLKDVPYCQRMVADWRAGIDRVLRGAPHLVLAHTAIEGFDPVPDCVIALTHLELAAHAHGLGTCWAGVVMWGVMLNPAALNFLDLPEGHRLYGAMMIGYPDVSYPRIPPRKPLDVRWA